MKQTCGAKHCNGAFGDNDTKCVVTRARSPKDKIEKKIDDCKVMVGSPLIIFLSNCNR
jgi:hypothetical protein